MRAAGRFEDVVRRRFQEGVAARQALLAPELVSSVADLAAELIRSFSSDGKLLLFGNGGSAADAQHLAAEFLGRFERDRPALPAIALADNASSLSAIANDYGYGEVFSRQVAGLGRPGDVAIGLSTSGRSENVVRGIETARAQGLRTVGLTGSPGRDLARVAELSVCVPSSDTARIQEAHMLIGHALCELVERELFAGDGEG